MGSIWNKYGKRGKIVLLILLLILLLSIIAYNLPRPIKFYGLGNTCANIVNGGGHAVEKDDYVYYSDINNDSILIKENIITGLKEKLTKHHFSYNLNSVGDYIYYTNGIPGEIRRVNILNRKNELLFSQLSQRKFLNKSPINAA